MALAGLTGLIEVDKLTRWQVEVVLVGLIKLIEVTATACSEQCVARCGVFWL